MALSGKSNFCIPSWLHRHTARQRFPSPSVGICRAVWLFMGYSALFIEPPSAGFAIMLGGLLAYSRIILSKCCVIRPFLVPFGYFPASFGYFPAPFPSVPRPKQRFQQDYPTRFPPSYTPSFTRKDPSLLIISSGGVGRVGDSRKFLWEYVRVWANVCNFVR